jgi:hypothetical protein
VSPLKAVARVKAQAEISNFLIPAKAVLKSSDKFEATPAPPQYFHFFYAVFLAFQAPQPPLYAYEPNIGT